MSSCLCLHQAELVGRFRWAGAGCYCRSWRTQVLSAKRCIEMHIYWEKDRRSIIINHQPRNSWNCLSSWGCSGSRSRLSILYSAWVHFIMAWRHEMTSKAYHKGSIYPRLFHFVGTWLHFHCCHPKNPRCFPRNICLWVSSRRRWLRRWFLHFDSDLWQVRNLKLSLARKLIIQ